MGGTEPIILPRGQPTGNARRTKVSWVYFKPKFPLKAVEDVTAFNGKNIHILGYWNTASFLLD